MLFLNLKCGGGSGSKDEVEDAGDSDGGGMGGKALPGGLVLLSQYLSSPCFSKASTMPKPLKKSTISSVVASSEARRRCSSSVSTASRNGSIVAMEFFWESANCLFKRIGPCKYIGWSHAVSSGETIVKTEPLRNVMDLALLERSGLVELLFPVELTLLHVSGADCAQPVFAGIGCSALCRWLG